MTRRSKSCLSSCIVSRWQSDHHSETRQFQQDRCHWFVFFPQRKTSLGHLWSSLSLSQQSSSSSRERHENNQIDDVNLSTNGPTKARVNQTVSASWWRSNACLNTSDETRLNRIQIHNGWHYYTNSFLVQRVILLYRSAHARARSPGHKYTHARACERLIVGSWTNNAFVWLAKHPLIDCKRMLTIDIVWLHCSAIDLNTKSNNNNNKHGDRSTALSSSSTWTMLDRAVSHFHFEALETFAMASVSHPLATRHVESLMISCMFTRSVGRCRSSHVWW